MNEDQNRDSRINKKAYNSLNPDILFEESDDEEIELPTDIIPYFYKHDDNYNLQYDEDGEFIGITQNTEKEDEDYDTGSLEFEFSSDICSVDEPKEDVNTTDQIKNIKTKHKKKKDKVYSCKISISWLPEEFEPKLHLPFVPDTFQLQSFYFLSKNQSIQVTAHTSSGKTTIVDYAIIKARINKSKVIYTSPIKALSNQKYNDFKHYKPGIITGDVSLNTESDVIIMTTEVLRNFLYSKNNIMHNVEFVIFDEIHYINDRERGVVWEECLILLPKYITIAMLSACIPNAVEFAAWVGRIRENVIYVIETNKRAVPLEYFLCEDENIKGIKGVSKGTSTKQKTDKIGKSIQKNIVGIRKKDNLLYLVNYVAKSNLIPAIFFCFSKRKCHDFCRRIIKPFLRESEKKEVLSIIKTRFNAKLSQAEQNLPQIVEVKEMLINGVGVHHSGLLPILKELVEILFSKNLIKILFATETFSMGVNFPAKSVIFISLKKTDVSGLRMLTPGEFMQMSGRAGRRGIDKRGVVIVNNSNEKYHENIEFIILNLIKSSSYIFSRFKLSYNMILQLVRSKTKIEDIIKKSFCEENIQKNLEVEIANLLKLEFILKEKTEKSQDVSDKLAKLGQNTSVVECSICEDIYEYINDISLFYNENNLLVSNFLKNEKAKDNFIFVMKDFTEKKFKDINTENTEIVNDLIEGIDLTEIYKAYVRHKNNASNNYGISDVLYVKINGVPFFDYKFDEYQFVLLELKVKENFKKLDEFTCKRCPFFIYHYEEALELIVLKKKIADIKLLFDDKSLNLYADYFEKLSLLKRNDYIDKNNNILIKGRIACEIRTVDEIIITEILVNNHFKDFDFSEIMSFASGLIVREESEIINNEKINRLIQEINKLYPFKYFNGYTNCIYDWCNNETLSAIVNTHRISEGVMVRTILRLNELCKEIMQACVLINELELYKKIENGTKILIRDIIFCSSMYFDE